MKMTKCLLATDDVSLVSLTLALLVSLCTKRHFDLQRVSHLAVNLTAVRLEARDYGKRSSNRCVCMETQSVGAS